MYAKINGNSITCVGFELLTVMIISQKTEIFKYYLVNLETSSRIFYCLMLVLHILWHIRLNLLRIIYKNRNVSIETYRRCLRLVYYKKTVKIFGTKYKMYEIFKELLCLLQISFDSYFFLFICQEAEELYRLQNYLFRRSQFPTYPSSFRYILHPIFIHSFSMHSQVLPTLSQNILRASPKTCKTSCEGVDLLYTFQDNVTRTSFFVIPSFIYCTLVAENCSNN